jgi:arylformamidase
MLKNYRIIDLSQKLYPGIHKITGEYMHGAGKPPYGNRRLELRQFIFKMDQHFMHWINTETHIGTHVEVSSHLRINGKEVGKSITEFPVETWLGEAVVLNFSHKKPVNSEGQQIFAEDLKKVKEGDIVLIWSDYPDESKEAPYINEEATEFLIKKKIKQLGLTGIGDRVCHNPILENEIPIIEGLINLDKIKKERVFYIGLPLNWYGMDASPIRAIAIEEI